MSPASWPANVPICPALPGSCELKHWAVSWNLANSSSVIFARTKPIRRAEMDSITSRGSTARQSAILPTISVGVLPVSKCSGRFESKNSADRAPSVTAGRRGASDAIRGDAGDAEEGDLSRHQGRCAAPDRGVRQAAQRGRFEQPKRVSLRIRRAPPRQRALCRRPPTAFRCSARRWSSSRQGRLKALLQT